MSLPGFGSSWGVFCGVVLLTGQARATSLAPETLGVLRELWEQTGGRGWTRCQWTPGLDPCAPPWGQPHWSVPADDDDQPWGSEVCFVCDGAANPSTLRAIDLAGSNLSGTLPLSLGQLTSLEFLDMSNNRLGGTLPVSIGALTRLTQLGLENNQLSGEIPGSIGSLTALVELGLSMNGLSGSIPESIGQLGSMTYLGINNNTLNGSLPAALFGLTGLKQLGLTGNRLTGPIPAAISNLTSLTFLTLGHNLLTGTIPESLGQLTALTYLFLANNVLEGSIPESLGNLTALTALGLEANLLTGRLPSTFGNLRSLREASLFGNMMSEVLTEPLPLSQFQGELALDLGGNRISAVGDVLAACTNPNSELTLDLSDNHIDAASFARILTSGSRCGNNFRLVVRNNSVETVNLASIVNYTQRYCGIDPCPERPDMQVQVDLSRNPLGRVTHTGLPRPPGRFPASRCFAVAIDLHNSSVDLEIVGPFSFEGVEWGRRNGGLFSLKLAQNRGVNLSIAREVSTAANPPESISLDLSEIGYMALPSGVFAGSVVTSIDLGGNEITELAPDAFDYGFALRTLNLASNRITVIPTAFLNNLPALAVFNVQHNSIVALPAANNHLAGPSTATGNLVQCSVYGGTASGCTCPAGFTFSAFCGYVRCTATPSGCVADSLLDASDCSLAPWSTCVNGSFPGRYYANGTFETITNCSTYLASTGNPAYEVAPPQRNAHGTAISDRLCSLCSTCPSGYTTVPCTATSDTQCTQTLSTAAIAAVVLSVVLLWLIGMLGAGYGRRQKKQRYRTQTELELTERLLGNVQSEKERADEEIADMEQAWVILEKDLTFVNVIGQGAYGTVFRGIWGHIPVAIKVLKNPLDDMDPSMRADFDREVKFMRSIRHPHILIFYGAGVDTNSRAFLVTELMAGSLKTLVLDQSTPISWKLRVTFATDIASGMAYLHERGTVHRDLKADNCFLSGDQRVKVGDFGTGRIAKHIQDTADTTAALASPATATTATAGRTLSKGVGSLLWMAPEALRGARLNDGLGSALDVYSYAIVLWEIWHRALPWDEIQEDVYIQFVSRLTKLVNDGARPEPRTDSEPPPAGYRELMEQCWADAPADRPTFATVLEALEEIRRVVFRRSETQFS